MTAPLAPEPTPPPPLHPLFRLVAALAARDRGPAGFEGTLALGVRGADGDTWWRLRFGARLEAAPVAGRPRGAQASLLLGAAAAEAMLRHGHFPADAPAWFVGDRAFAARAVERLTTRTSWLGLRAQTAARPARRRRRAARR